MLFDVTFGDPTGVIVAADTWSLGQLSSKAGLVIHTVLSVRNVTARRA